MCVLKNTSYLFIALCMIVNNASSSPFSDLGINLSTKVGGLLNKKENEEFQKYRNSPLYSSFFSFQITNVQDFKSVLDSYKKQLLNWNSTTVSTFNIQVTGLNARISNPLFSARIYNLFEYMIHQDIYLDRDIKDEIINVFLKTCRPSHPIQAEQLIKKGKVIPFKDYLFLSEKCSKSAYDLLQSQEKNIQMFLGNVIAKKEKNDSLDDWDVVEKSEVIKSNLYELRAQCKQNITPQCNKIIGALYFASKNRPLTAILYGKGHVFPGIKISEAAESSLKRCYSSEVLTQECHTLIKKVIQKWDEIDGEKDTELQPNLSSYFINHPEMLNQILNESDFNRQVIFENYNGYKDIEDIFSHVYSMACAFDLTFRLRVSATEKASFVEQTIATSDLDIAKKARQGLSFVGDKIQNLSQSDNKALSKIGKTASSKFSTNASKDISENDDIVIAPEFINYYIKDWERYTTQRIIIGPQLENVHVKTIAETISDVLKNAEPVDMKKLKDVANIEVDYDSLYAILSKICMAILGPEYLKAEQDLIKAIESQDRNTFEKTIAETSGDIKNEKEASTKDARAFRYLPSNEYNKLRQIALIMLTNIHVLLIDERERKQGKQGSFYQVSTQIKAALEQQLSFFARFIYALKEKKFDSISLSTSSLSYAFAEVFLKPIYPITLNANEKIPNQTTLIDADGTNMYSLYASYLLGSIYGVVNIEKNDVMLDNRSQKNKLIGDFRRTFGLKAEISIDYMLSGAIKTVLSSVTPIPPIFTGIIASGASMILLAGPQEIYKALKKTCRFNKEKCVSKTVQDINFSKPLEVRVTEFLMAFGDSLQKILSTKNEQLKTETERKFTKTMVTLYVMENDDIVRLRNLNNPEIKSIEDLLETLLNRSSEYYRNLEKPDDTIEKDFLLADPATETQENFLA